MVSAWFAAQHARDQESIANNLAVALFPLWGIMRFTELDASTASWLPAVLPRVETAFFQSQRLSAVFNANVRAAELPLEPALVMDVPDVQFSEGVPRISFEMPPVDEPPGVEQVRVQLPEFSRDEVATSLTIEANYQTKRAMPGPEAELMRNALVRSSGAAVRQAMNGGRGVTNEVMRVDRRVVGFARVTDNNPCAFCALLASRGAVYGKGAFARSDSAREADRANPKSTWAKNPEAARDVPDGWTNVAKVHNNCRCHLRPVFANESRWDAAARHFLQLWEDRWKNSGETKQEAIDAVLSTNPKMSGYALSRAIDLRAFKRKLEKNPFKGSQFDLNTMRRDLTARREGLLDAGVTPNSANFRWTERSLVLLDR